jgi:phage gp29-like protein
VRKVEELRKNEMIASTVKLLSIVDERIFDTSEAIFRRFSNSELIRYDSEVIGGPLVTRRERKLLQSIDLKLN